MTGKRSGMWLGALLVIGAAAVGLSGCDYWPPALQEQIEQLRSEAQATEMERTRLQQELKEASTEREALQAKANELTRMNQELSGRIAVLEKNLAAEQAKVAKLAGSTKRATPKAKTKKSSGAPTMKKPAKPSR